MAKRQKDTEPGDSQRAAEIIDLLRARGLRICAAESLTGGLVAAAFVSVPGASEVFDGALVAYNNALKSRLLSVDAEWLASEGAINARAAQEMAVGARQLFGSDVAISTTGVAGPTPADGAPPGTAYVAVSIMGRDVAVRAVRLTGGRSRVRGRVVARSLELCEAALRQLPVAGEGYDQAGDFA